MLIFDSFQFIRSGDITGYIFKIGNISYFSVAIIARNENYDYNITIPKHFCPENRIIFKLPVIDKQELSGATFSVDSNGVIKVLSDYQNIICSGVYVWKTK